MDISDPSGPLPKIALVRQRYTSFGGAERFVDRALRALRQQSAELTLITRRWKGDPQFHIQRCAPFYLGRLWRDWSFARCVCKHVSEQAYDLVQSHERIACCDIYRAGDGVHREWLSQRNRVLNRASRLAQGWNPYHRYVLAAERRLFASPRLKAVICNSRMVKQEIQHYFGVDDEKLHVIYNGVDTEAFHPRLRAEHRQAMRWHWRIPEDAPLFLFVGAGFERKGVPALLQAMEQLPPRVHLLIVGKDKKMAHYRRQAAQAGLRNRVLFAGPQRDVRPYYGASDVLVLPTLYDPFPNAALEAMAAGLPVITSTKCGTADVIENGRNGFVCDALAADTLAEHMQMLCSPQARESMGAAARATAEPLTLDNMSQQLFDLYLGLLPR
jgi:UDP-glucose:(heptosyl)LPS alpha-1,3-glucosyltransferase